MKDTAICTNPSNGQALLIGAIISFLSLLFVLWNITHQGNLTAINLPIHAYLQSISTHTLDKIMTLFTLLGDRKCILGFAVMMLGWLVWQRHWRAASHWFMLMVLVLGSALAIKHGYYSPRPMPDLPSNSLSSLPSGHTVFTLAFFGFLAVLIGEEVSIRKKIVCYSIALSIVLLAAFSRVYLGPHWPTDIISSFLLGLACLLLVTFSYRRNHRAHLPVKKLSVASIMILMIIWTSYSALKYSSTLNFHLQRSERAL